MKVGGKMTGKQEKVKWNIKMGTHIKESGRMV